MKLHAALTLTNPSTNGQVIPAITQNIPRGVAEPVLEGVMTSVRLSLWFLEGNPFRQGGIAFSLAVWGS